MHRTTLRGHLVGAACLAHVGVNLHMHRANSQSVHPANQSINLTFQQPPGAEICLRVAGNSNQPRCCQEGGNPPLPPQPGNNPRRDETCANDAKTAQMLSIAVHSAEYRCSCPHLPHQAKAEHTHSSRRSPKITNLNIMAPLSMEPIRYQLILK